MIYVYGQHSDLETKLFQDGGIFLRRFSFTDFGLKLCVLTIYNFSEIQSK